MLRRTILAVLWAGLTAAQCSQGCLRCNARNQCLLCDITLRYFLSDTTCESSRHTHCEQIALNGQCVQCKKNFFLDVNVQVCLAVPTVNLVPKCIFYNSAQVCVLCEHEHFVSQGVCKEVEKLVYFCLQYSADGICAACVNGYIISPTLDTCTPVINAPPCLFYTFIGCKKCKTGFIQNPNFYFSQYISNAYIHNRYLVPAINGFTGWLPLAECQATVVPNCVFFAAFDKCQKCRDGYFVQEGACIANPPPVIAECLIYASLTACRQCKNNMLLRGNACLPVIQISNCQTYSGSASTSMCTKCTSNFYLHNNACVDRTSSLKILNCQTKAVSSDECETCATGFFLTTDQKFCLPVLPNCDAYAKSSFASTFLTCTRCRNGHYLSDNGPTAVCLAGTIQYCLTYNSNTNTCVACMNGYYLSNGLCPAHVAIPDCLTYDPIKPHFCTVCNTGFYNFAFSSVCVQTARIAGCSIFQSDGGTCKTCQPTFYLLNGSCLAIPIAFANCTTFSGTACTKCDANFMVNTLTPVGTCVAPLDYLVSSKNSPCWQMATFSSSLTPTWRATPSATQTTLTCETCGDFMYGYSPQNAEAICVQTTQLFMYSSFAPVANCIRFGLNYAATQSVRVIVCMQCASQFFLTNYNNLAERSSATACTATCALTASAGSSAIIVDDMLGFVNICAGVGVAADMWFPSENCNRYARVSLSRVGVAGQIADYLCLSANKGTDPGTPANFLLYDLTSAMNNRVLYAFDQPNSENQVATIVFGTGFASGPDSSSVTPTVFNYQGLLNGPSYTTQILRLNTATDPAISENLQGNHLNFCDILVLFRATFGGTAFNNAATTFNFLTTAKWGCFRCQFGHQLSFQAGLIPTATPPLPSCVQMTSCTSSSLVHGGLSHFLNTILSCHVCLHVGSEKAYPTIYIETDGAGSQNGLFLGFRTESVFSVSNGISFVNANSGFKCATAPAQVVIDSTANLNRGIVTNCAVFGSIEASTAANYPLTAAANKAPQPVCLACAANFFPTYLGPFSGASGVAANNLPRWVVRACSASSNCDTTAQSAFNSCTRCRKDQETNAIPAYFAFHDLTLTHCFQTPTPDCFLLSSSGFLSTSTTNACEVCKAGFFLNGDGVCESLRVPNQTTRRGVFTFAYAASIAYVEGVAQTLTNSASFRHARIHYLLSFSGLQYGVSDCASGYIPAPVSPWAPRFCVWSSYIFNTDSVKQIQSVFVKNCMRYNLNTVLNKNICAGCIPGFIPLQDGSRCVFASNVPNCVLTQNEPFTSVCFQCISKFRNILGVCTTLIITNCATYQNTETSFATPTVLLCAFCTSGYVLSFNFEMCLLGNVANCALYVQGDANKCVTCAPGFVLMQLDSAHYCYPVPASLNCAVMQDPISTTGPGYGTLSCSECRNNALSVFGVRNWVTLGLLSVAQTTCMPFTLTPNCTAYNQNSLNIKANTFGCTQCISGYWFNQANRTCVLRLAHHPACTSYNNTADLCLDCASGYFLASNGSSCVENPWGIFQCAVYSSAFQCSQCNPGYFVDETICSPSTIISNCLVYSQNYTCIVCANGYFRNSSTSCIVAAATGCLNYTSVNACANCRPGLGLKTTDQVTHCVSNSLPNCVEATTFFPFTCGVCATGYFANPGGVCVAVAKTIDNCVTYDSEFTCSACTPGAVLNTTRQNCYQTWYKDYIDPNCENSVLLRNPACAHCPFGSHFVDGACKQCTNNTVEDGCLNCNPLNHDVCLVCLPSYYMNSSGLCTINDATPQITGNISNLSNTLTQVMTRDNEILRSLAKMLILTLFHLIK